MNESTPLMIGGVIYTSTSLNQVAAINAVTGETIWVHDPKTYEDGTPANTGFVHRGVSYWEAGADKRILFGTGDGYLSALDAETGKPIQGFGEGGRVDLTMGLRRPVNRRLYAVFLAAGHLPKRGCCWLHSPRFFRGRGAAAKADAAGRC